MNQNIKIVLITLNFILLFVLSFLVFQCSVVSNEDETKLSDKKEDISDNLLLSDSKNNSSNFIPRLDGFDPGKVWIGDVDGNDKKNIIIAIPQPDGTYYYEIFEPGTIWYYYGDEFHSKLSEEVEAFLISNKLESFNWSINGILNNKSSEFPGLSLAIWDPNNPVQTMRYIDFPCWWQFQIK